MGAPTRASKTPPAKSGSARSAFSSAQVHSAPAKPASRPDPAKPAIEGKPLAAPAPNAAALAKAKARALEGPEAIKALLGAATPKARELAETLRRLVKKAATDATESADLATGAVTFARKKPFCSITPAAEHVTFSFHRGADLDDPESILTGSGKGFRHIHVAQVHDIRGGAFERFVRQARDLANR